LDDSAVLAPAVSGTRFEFDIESEDESDFVPVMSAAATASLAPDRVRRAETTPGPQAQGGAFSSFSGQLKELSQRTISFGAGQGQQQRRTTAQARGQSFNGPRASVLKRSSSIAARTLSFGSTPQKRVIPTVRERERELLSNGRNLGLDLATTGVSWKEDLFTVPHNAVRQELKTLEVMVDSLNKRQFDVTKTDLETFNKWLKVFRRFLEDYFAMEDEVIFYWIEIWKVCLPSNLSFEYREAKRNEIKKVFNQMSTQYSHFRLDRAVDWLQGFLSTTRRIAPIIVEYFDKQELALPPLLERSRDIDSTEFVAVQKSLYTFMSRLSSPHTFFVLYTRWIDNPETVDKMQTEFFYLAGPPGLLSAMFQRRKHAAIKRKLIASHFSTMEKLAAGVH